MIDLVNYLENKYEDLKFELTLEMDEYVKEEIKQELNRTYLMLKHNLNQINKV